MSCSPFSIRDSTMASARPCSSSVPIMYSSVARALVRHSCLPRRHSCRRLAECQAAWQKLARRTALPSSQPAAAYQIDGEAAEPVAAFVVLALNAVEPGLFELARQRDQRRAARIVSTEFGHDPLQHPRATQVQACQVVELAIGHEIGRAH